MLQVYESNSKDLWHVFRKHHYLSGDFNKAAKMYLVYWNDTLVGMNSVLPIPSGTAKHMFRSHRLVILPDYQGLGIGTKLNDLIAKQYHDRGMRYMIKTSHAKLIRHLDNDKRWKGTTQNKKDRTNDNYESDMLHKTKSECELKFLKQRICGSYEYVGEDFYDKPYKEIIIGEVSDKFIPKLKSELIRLSKKFYIRVIHGYPKEDTNVDLVCQELGIVVEPLMYKKNGVYEIKKKYQGKKIISKTE